MQTKQKKKLVTCAMILGMSITTIVGAVAIMQNDGFVGHATNADLANRFVFDVNATATADGYSVLTDKGNTFSVTADGVTKGTTVMDFAAGATLKNVAGSGVKGLNSMVFDTVTGSFVLKVGKNPNHLWTSYNITAGQTVDFANAVSYFELAAEDAASVKSITFNYACTDVIDDSEHKPSGVYTTNEIDGVIYMHDTCKCGAIVGEAVKEVAKKTGATLDITTSSSYSWTQDATTGVWTSGNKGVTGGSSSYLWAEALTAGNVTFDYTSSGEGGYDYLFVGKSSTESQALVNCKGSGTSENNKSGTYSVDLAKGEKLHFIFKKDSSGDKGKDCATIKFAAATFEYAALSFNVDGGSAVAPMFLINGAPEAAVTATPTKDGHYFEGWYVDENLNVPYTSDYVFEGDSILYAKWSKALTMHYYKNDGTQDVTDVKFQQGTIPGSIDDPTREGYYFIGWYTSATEFTAANKYVPAAATADVTVYAGWLDKSQASPFYGDYKGIKFYVYSSSWTASTSYPDFKVDVVGNYDMRTAYSSYVYGTITDYDVTTGVITTAQNGSKTYGGKYMYAVEDDVIIATESGSNKLGNGTFYVYQRGATSYFTGCKVTALNSNKLIAASFPVKGVTKYILVDANTGALTYDVSFDSLFTGNAITDVTKLSNEFGFSVTDQDGNVVKYYATKTSKTYTTTTDGYEGVYKTSDDSDTLYVTGTGLWQTKKNSSSMTLSTSATYTELSENVIYAKYSSTIRYNFTLDKANHKFTSVVPKVKVTLDYNYDIEGEPVVEEQYWTKEVYTPINPTLSLERAGYIFDAWYDAPTGGTKITGNRSLVADTTFYAHWNTAIVLTVHPNNGDANYTKSGVAGTSVTLTEPVLAGKLFVGWFTDEDFVNAWDGKFAAENFDVYAKYENAPKWSSKDTAEAVTPVEGVYSFGGSTTAKCQTYYVKMHLTAGTYMMTFTQTSFTKVGSDGGQHYARANVINNGGSAMISSAVNSGSSGTFSVATEGDYFFVYNAGGKVPGSSYTYQGYGTFNGKVAALENCDENTSLVYTVGAEAMTITKTPSTSINRVVKVDLVAGDYTLSVSATERASTYIYGSMTGGKGSNQVASLTVYESIGFAGTKDFSITTAGTYYFASAYGVTFSIVSK